MQYIRDKRVIVSEEQKEKDIKYIDAILNNFTKKEYSTDNLDTILDNIKHINPRLVLSVMKLYRACFRANNITTSLITKVNRTTAYTDVILVTRLSLQYYGLIKLKKENKELRLILSQQQEGGYYDK